MLRKFFAPNIQRIVGIRAIGAVLEKGFYLFKNSWGATRFGSEQVPGTTVHPTGYGWISQRYVQEFMAAHVSGIPRLMRSEVCNDTIDNDGDTRADYLDLLMSTQEANLWALEKMP